MDLTIPAKNLKTFTAAIQSLAKTGATLFISCQPDELTLRTINDGKSSFMCATFARSFFEGSGPLVTMSPADLKKRKNKRKRSRARSRSNNDSSSDSSTDEEDPDNSQKVRYSTTAPSQSQSSEITYFKAKVLLKQVSAHWLSISPPHSDPPKAVRVCGERFLKCWNRNDDHAISRPFAPHLL